ncbi:MAG: hypothetical protein RR552_02235 [Oscillospiraceae bacterium]
MNSLQIFSKISLPTQCGSKYKGIAFDGCYYYFCNPQRCEIIKYNKSFCIVECIKTCRPYSAICYDKCEKKFWASSDCVAGEIFSLNSCFEEIDSVIIRSCECRCSIIMGLSYDCRNDCLIVGFTNCILAVSLTVCHKEKVLKKFNCTWDTGILSISPSYVVIETKGCQQYIVFYDECFNEKRRYEVPCDYFAIDVILEPCKSNCVNGYEFYILATKNCCYTFLLKCIINSGDIWIDDCNFSCEPPCPEPPCPCPQHACSDLIESVALIETSLSHILNAEGEKLQKVIKSTDDVEKILCVNDSISNTIVKITHLEILLHDKLSAIKGCCDLNCDCDYDCDCGTIDDCTSSNCL